MKKVADWGSLLGLCASRKQGIVGVFGALLLLASLGCARKSAPEGGPYDMTPPRMVKELPASGTTNVEKGRFRVYFDEIVQLKGQSEKVIISPPQKNAPKMISMGHYISVVLQDTLLPNTTYTIDFADAIVDNNEGNPMPSYVYAFSTGNTIDTLQISGRIIDSRTLRPMPNILVGVYADSTQSSFAEKAMLRATRSDENGNFTLGYMADGAYRLVALEDIDKSYSFNNKNERFAYVDTLCRPLPKGLPIEKAKDTTALASDSLRPLPASALLLRLSAPYVAQPSLQKAERVDSLSCRLLFSAPLDSIPAVQIAAPRALANQKVYASWGENKKTVLYHWKKYPQASQDTIAIQGRFPKADSLGVVHTAVETLHLFPARKATDQSRTASSALQSGEKNFLSFKTSSGIDKETPRDSLVLSFTRPVEKIDTTRIKLLEYQDTIPQPIAFEVRPVPMVSNLLELVWNKQFGRKYECVVDSMAFVSIYGEKNARAKHTLTIRPESSFGSLVLAMPKGGASAPVYLELLDAKETVLATQLLRDSVARFDCLLPADYFLRLYIDSNRNGIWDNASWNPYHPAEEVFYYPKALAVKAKFETKESWDPRKVPLQEQRPSALNATEQSDKAGNNSSSRKTNLNEEYIQRMKERYGDKWNPSDRERQLLGMPSRAEEKKKALQEIKEKQ